MDRRVSRRLYSAPRTSGEWTSVFGSERLTGALLDRLIHHVHILEMNGDSYSLNQSKSRSRRAKSDMPPDDATQG
jgi:DNA replication protein DnaC